VTSGVNVTAYIWSVCKVAVLAGLVRHITFFASRRDMRAPAQTEKTGTCDLNQSFTQMQKIEAVDVVWWQKCLSFEASEHMYIRISASQYKKSGMHVSASQNTGIVPCANTYPVIVLLQQTAPSMTENNRKLLKMNPIWGFCRG